ncbi:MAG: hypothetical protein JRC86_01020, partial [Deltaproteobacteria bacterium]|nr:hypothetical protein [Deltaproteobacteria bacterium]
MKRRVRQILIGVALFFGITMVLLMGVSLYLNTTHGQKSIQATVNKNIPGSVTWDYGRLSFMKGEIEVKNAVIK